jgi:DnaJ-class molecular chaperone
MTLEQARMVLGVDAAASSEAVRAAYVAAVRAAHPDTTTSYASASIAELQTAYRVLRDDISSCNECNVMPSLRVVRRGWTV